MALNSDVPTFCNKDSVCILCGCKAVANIKDKEVYEVYKKQIQAYMRKHQGSEALAEKIIGQSLVEVAASLAVIGTPGVFYAGHYNLFVCFNCLVDGRLISTLIADYILELAKGESLEEANQLASQYLELVSHSVKHKIREYIQRHG